MYNQKHFQVMNITALVKLAMLSIIRVKKLCDRSMTATVKRFYHYLMNISRI